MRVCTFVLVVWLVIGGIAAGQRGYFKGSQRTCAHAGTVLATFVSGPLNYMGVNPKVHCKLAQPSS